MSIAFSLTAITAGCFNWRKEFKRSCLGQDLSMVDRHPGSEAAAGVVRGPSIQAAVFFAAGLWRGDTPCPGKNKPCRRGSALSWRRCPGSVTTSRHAVSSPPSQLTLFSLFIPSTFFPSGTAARSSRRWDIFSSPRCSSRTSSYQQVSPRSSYLPERLSALIPPAVDVLLTFLLAMSRFADDRQV